MWKLELRKHLCEQPEQLLKKMSKEQNIKISNSSSIKWGRWTCFTRRHRTQIKRLIYIQFTSCVCGVVTYWFETINYQLYFHFEIFCRPRFKFPIGNFTVVLIRNFFPDWEREFLKQFGLHRYFSGNWWNWCKNDLL